MVVEVCGRPLLLGKNERSEIGCCVNPSLRRRRADARELADHLARSPCPPLASARKGRKRVCLFLFCSPPFVQQKCFISESVCPLWLIVRSGVKLYILGSTAARQLRCSWLQCGPTARSSPGAGGLSVCCCCCV